jgi:hypothetical protein
MRLDMSSEFPRCVNDLLGNFASEAGADGVTLWLADGVDLVATSNPLEPDVPGLRQPLARGIISQVYLTGIGMIEATPTAHPAHDSSVDLRLGKRTTAIMAVPVDLGPHGDGVLSTVRHQGGLAGAFDLAALALLERTAADLTRRVLE